jgi:DNA-binding NarL/FixJ family response regulator
MIKISIISSDIEYAENLKKNIGKHYFVNGIYLNIDDLITNTEKISLPTIILYCNNDLDDINKLKKLLKKSKVIIFNNLENDKLLFNAIHLGIKSFVHHSQTMNELLDIIELVSTGGTYVSNYITYRLFEFIKDITDFMLGKKIKNYHTLTKREIMVLEVLLNGNSYKSIAIYLNISVDTVRKHISRIYKKLKIHSKGELYSKHFNIECKSKHYEHFFLKHINQLSI